MSKEHLIEKLEDYKVKVCSSLCRVLVICNVMQNSAIKVLATCSNKVKFSLTVLGTGKTEEVGIRACRIEKQGNATFVPGYFLSHLIAMSSSGH